MKKVLILMSERTGTGHKASANAIEAKLKELGYETKQLNCFKTMGDIGVKMENCYIPLVTQYPLIWKISHSFSQNFTNSTHEFVYNHCKKEMLKQIKEFKPNLIISDHCMFTKAISKLLRKNHLNIPFMVAVIDLVNPPNVWRDKQANISFLPTPEVYEQYIRLGFRPEQLVVSGFPIREDIKVLSMPKKQTDKTNILLVTPSINLKKNLKIAKQVNKVYNANITFVCGRDAKLYYALTKEQSKGHLQNIKVLGFVNNMNELLDSAHILLTKAGPNMLLEGTRSGTAVIVTDHIPGQEAQNFRYITDNGYGIKCEKTNKLYALITNMIETRTLQTYLNNVVATKHNNGAQIIAQNIDNFLKSVNF